MTERADQIRGTAKDLMADFLYYDRKEDEDLPVGAIEDAIEAEEITIEEIVKIFEAELNDRFE